MTPYTISYSPDPSFQRGDRTLGAAYQTTTFNIVQDTTKTLECFAITDAQGVSPAVQGMGYDPYPDIPAPTIQQDGLWWGDNVTLNGNYLGLMPEENFVGLAAREMRATSVTDGGSGFATSATFPIPDDGRGAYAYLSTHGRAPASGAPLVHLYPRGIAAYSNIRCVIYAPPTGHIWVAADGKVDEIDVFQHDPMIVRSITTYAKPYLSQCSSGGYLLVVDGVSGVGQIDQIDATSGAVTLYASTTDTIHNPNFTRAIRPVGIAVDPDGSAAYIADATGGAGYSTPVRFPAANGSAITDNYGNSPYWSFPDPCGTDVGLTHELFLGSAGLWIGYVTAPGGAPQSTQTYYDSGTSSTPVAILVDRDVSTAAVSRYYWNNTPWTMAFNQNSIASFGGTSAARFLGADVAAQLGGRLSVEPLWEYTVAGNAPKPVILNNSGQSWPYISNYQTADRLVRLTVRGWQGVPVHLRLTDPPDTAGYAPTGGWPAKGGAAVPPYEAHDNDVWLDIGVTDYGLTTDPTGTLHPTLPGQPPVLEIDVTPDSTNTAVYYLKLPPRYAGDNWQVEVTKKTALGGLVPNKIPSYSALFTGWKRVFVERDKMFKRGGLLAVDAAQGQSSVYVAKTWDAANSRWVRGDTLAMNDKVAVFDTGSPFEGAHNEGCIIGLDPTDDVTRWITVTLGNLQCGGSFVLTHDYSSSVDALGVWAFTSGTRSGALGVIQSTDGQITDTSANQINGTGSAFYDADTRNIQQPYDDAFVQFISPRGGDGAVPYLPPGVLSMEDYTPPCTSATNAQRTQALMRYGWAWFGSQATLSNYFHLIGIACPPLIACKSTYEYTGVTPTPISTHLSLVSPCVPMQTQPSFVREVTQDACCHEPAHQFEINQCIAGDSGHDSDNAWCGTCGGSGIEKCLMNESRNSTNSIIEFGSIDMEGPNPACSSNSESSLRTHTDPIP